MVIYIIYIYKKKYGHVKNLVRKKEMNLFKATVDVCDFISVSIVSDCFVSE